MPNPLSSLLKIVLPSKKANEKGTGFTPTYNAASPNTTLSVPQYREHLTDIFDTRTVTDSRALLKELFKHDPDVSAAVHAYLTVADTDPYYRVVDEEGNIDHDGMKLLDGVLYALTTRLDYSKGFQYRPSLRTIAENMRYMLLLRGGIGAELVVNKQMLPNEVRNVDLATVEWKETVPGKLQPIQKVGGKEINLDIPSFFVAFFRRDPTSIYPYSHFVAAINTIAARQQVINALYRIMTVTGFPRVTVSVVEEVLRKVAPADAKADENKMREWMNQRLAEIGSQVNNLRPDSALVHFDSVEPKIINDKNPAAALDVSKIIETLNAANQAALKVMSTVIGRGDSGVNTASVEARIFSMSAEALNGPIAEILSQIFTLALRLHGHLGHVEVGFDKVDLRPDLELEPQRTMKQARLLELLSLGIISDDDFHFEVFGRYRPDSAPELSGTGFMTKSAGVDASNVSPNGDPLGRSVASPDAKQAKSNTVKKVKATLSEKVLEAVRSS